MPNLMDHFKRYLQQTLAVTVSPCPWPGRERLPVFLQDRYAFYRVKMLELPCLLMVDLGDQEQPPAILGKHMAQVRGKCDDAIVYVRERITAYNRMRLIEHRVPFVVPGNQLYVPMLGLDLREHFRRQQKTPLAFSPSTQAAILHWLYHGTQGVCTPSEMVPPLGYTKMTMTRAFNELEAVQLGTFAQAGRERRVAFACSRRELWVKAEPFLRSPVRKRVHILPVDGATLAFRAGLSALAEYSMLGAPGNPVFAMGQKEWQLLRQRHTLVELDTPEPQSLEVELWRYAPGLFARDGVVDRLSLYLSLKATPDERVESALAGMMEAFEW
ncbi:MAG: hypothetical protein A3K19_25860 [Lentisphaerae bacterium RIFOXYB12_FULL_65_16]|nr:MAG: hypothetical protein A3K18_31860 [Lentisphaerae bacterium RIFOXYA12_64_32]OGV91397.1 MAG: hypothetical protein A3K19_25860 [Lentisphaerae bacterium RIFOXYB12_FULL_65_16]